MMAGGDGGDRGSCGGVKRLRTDATASCNHTLQPCNGDRG